MSHAAELDAEAAEISWPVHEALGSWRRVFGARRADVPAQPLLREAAAELWQILNIDRTVHPDAHPVTRQVVVDALAAMAEATGIATDDAQLILAENFKAHPTIREGQQAKPPPPRGPQDYGTAAARISATPYAWVNPSRIPRRQWLYRPHYIRKFLSATFSTGGVGKSSLVIAEVLAMVTDKPLLEICPSTALNAWYWNGEDPRDELDRRFAAAGKHYELTPDDIGDRLFVDSGRAMPIIIAEETRTGTRVAEPAVEQVIATLVDKRIDVLVVDPFVSCHRVPENDNSAIERVAKSWAHIAEVANCSVMLVHHVRKTGGESVTVEDGRGASALLAAARTARTLNSMTPREAEDAEVAEKDRRLHFRADIGKANLTRPAEQADWFKLVSIDLQNNEVGFGGDEVGVVTAWNYPQADEAKIAVSDLAKMKDAINAGGPWRADAQAKNEPWIGVPVAQALGRDLLRKTHKRAVAGMVRDLLQTGVLRLAYGKDTGRKARSYVEVTPDAPPTTSGAGS
jgi:AAA domain